jgi:hypothetical protein
MTPRQLEILQHAVGADQYGKRKQFDGRNFFCAGAADVPDCRSLVELGYMQQHKRTELYPYFNCSVTGDGINAMLRESPAPPKLTRSQQRYRRFLDADSGMSFRDWMRYEQDSRFRME